MATNHGTQASAAAEAGKALSTDAVNVVGDADDDGWTLTFRPALDHEDRPTRRAWLTIEWVGWLVRDMRRSDALDGCPSRLDTAFEATPPWLNEPGCMLTFYIESNEARHPLADFVATYVRLWNDTHESPKLAAP